MLNWYLACHQPGKEKVYKAQLELARLHINSFFPLIHLTRKRPDTSALRTVIEPLFYGYIFVEFDPEITHTTQLTALPSISHFVRFGREMKPLPEQLAESLQSFSLSSSVNATISCHYKEKISSIIHVKNKHERTVMLLNFIQTTDTPLRKPS